MHNNDERKEGSGGKQRRIRTSVGRTSLEKEKKRKDVKVKCNSNYMLIKRKKEWKGVCS